MTKQHQPVPAKIGGLRAKLARFFKVPLTIRLIILYACFSVASWQLAVITTVPALSYVPAPAKVKPAVQAKPIIRGKPVTILVPRLAIELPIIDGAYDSTTDTWTLSDTMAQFATMTDQPNDTSGDTFIYGHNTDRVFARLSGLIEGDIAQIKTDNGHTFSYTYSGQQFVQPANTTVLSEQPPAPRLTLMTCEGFLSQTRRIMYFDFTEVT